MEVRVLKLSEIAKCPKGSLLPAHYHSDGRCRCGERDAADKALVEAQDAAREADKRVRDARRWKAST